MEEKDAVDLLSKLEKFMKDTTNAIKSLQLRTYNLGVDLENLKKEKSRIILR